MQSYRSRFTYTLVTFALLGAALIFGESRGRAESLASLDLSDPRLVEAGRYLADAGDCVSCHTRQGGPPFAGGRALDTPFGVIYSANITSETATGIGAWSEEQIGHALRQGIAADGTHLYPAFPYTAYTGISDADVHALYAYLRTLRPVKYAPPHNDLPFPFNVRASLALWNMLFFTDARFVPDATRSAEWNRGAYLTRTFGHCSSCHSPRNALGGERTSLEFTGGVYLDEVADAVSNDKVTPLEERTVRNWSAPNLTSASNGLGAWSIEEITSYLQTGHNARAGAFGPMSTVVMNSTSRLTHSDAHAIAVYLKTLKPAEQYVETKGDAQQLKMGEIVYTSRCSDCHQSTGLGMPRTANSDPSKTAPPLAGNAVLQAPDPSSLINIILYGAHEADSVTGSWPRMSGFELSVGLDDEQIAALCSYLRRSWGNSASAVTSTQVSRQH
jgi:mono/diheme cytochrome c family protein